MKQFILKSIRFYQKHLNINNSLTRALFLTDSSCRFLPTCSEYSYQAIGKYGILQGSFLALKRIIRCHPFSKGGPDPVE
ncbi:membrane protein insertion efficiency factor YidD [Candidatus Gottesmanbacteria bacterium]|nr:membrane protein insertion efficiency factor YidD [Candidatus Gottesmanbacteria bacterium]